MYLRFLTTSIFYHYILNNETPSILHTLSKVLGGGGNESWTGKLRRLTHVSSRCLINTHRSIPCSLFRYICAPKYRGQGHGLNVFNRGMTYLEGRVIGLDAVEAQQKNYEKQGFVATYKNFRFQGVPVPGGSPNGNSTPTAAAADERDDGLKVQELKDDDIEAVLKYDKDFVSAPRETFLRAWLTNPGHVTKVVFDEESGKVLGYGVIRPSVDGFRVAPLFADSAVIAETLFWALVATTPRGSRCALDIPETNTEGMRFAESLGFSVGVWFWRMYRGTPPSLPSERIFGITSLEIG